MTLAQESDHADPQSLSFTLLSSLIYNGIGVRAAETRSSGASLVSQDARLIRTEPRGSLLGSVCLRRFNQFLTFAKIGRSRPACRAFLRLVRTSARSIWKKLALELGLGATRSPSTSGRRLMP